MLSAFVFSLLTALSHSFFGLSANARGIVCVEATQPKQGFPYCISPSQSMDDSGNILFHDKFGIDCFAGLYASLWEGIFGISLKRKYILMRDSHIPSLRPVPGEYWAKYANTLRSPLSHLSREWKKVRSHHATLKC